MKWFCVISLANSSLLHWLRWWCEVCLTSGISCCFYLLRLRHSVLWRKETPQQGQRSQFSAFGNWNRFLRPIPEGKKTETQIFHLKSPKCIERKQAAAGELRLEYYKTDGKEDTGHDRWAVFCYQNKESPFWTREKISGEVKRARVTGPDPWPTPYPDSPPPLSWYYSLSSWIGISKYISESQSRGTCCHFLHGTLGGGSL